MSPSTVSALAPHRYRALVATLARRRETATPVGTVLHGRELCSADFISGPGWARRVTEVLVRARAADAAPARRRSA